MEIGRIKRNGEEIVISHRHIGLPLSTKHLWDNFSKLAVLTIISGYLKSDLIAVNDLFSKQISLRRLGGFLAYTLNHHISPKKFSTRVTLTTTKAKDKKTAVSDIRLSKASAILAFSGGLDSTAGLLYALDKKQTILPLWVNFGQRNSQAEGVSVLKILKKLKLKPFVVRLNLNHYILGGWKEWNFIIPGRNFLFVSLANSLLRLSSASRKYIFLCAHKDEMMYSKNRDKSHYFFNKSSHFFSIGAGQKIVVASPFAQYSKAEVLSYWRRHWEKKYRVSPIDTSTCYYGHHCGRCAACLKRSIQLLAAGYPAQKVLDYPFSDKPGLIKKQWLPKIKQGQMSRNNKLDFIIALEKNLAGAAPYIKEFYAGLSAQTLGAAARRKKEIENSEII